MGPGSHSFLVIPNCPYPLLGRDLFTKVGAQITFNKDGVSIANQDGQTIQILTLLLEDEYRLYQELPLVLQDMTTWLAQYPEAFAETGEMSLAKH